MNKLRVGVRHLLLGLMLLLIRPPVIAAEYGDNLAFFPPQTCSMEFRDAEVKNVLRSLAEPYKINLLVSKDVKGTITASFHNVYIKDVFLAVLRDAGLDYVKEGDIIYIDTFDSLERKKKLAPLITKSVQVNYAFDSSTEGNQDLTQLANKLSNMLSGRQGSQISVIPRTNTLLVTDIPEYTEKIVAMIRELDKESPQITITAKIASISLDYAKELGVQWGGKVNTGGKYVDPDGTTQQTFTAQGGTLMGVGGTSGENFVVDLPASVSSGTGGALNLLIGKIGSEVLEVQLSAMESKGKGSILSAPKVITQDNQSAKMESTFKIPYQEVNTSTSGVTTFTYKFVDVIISLEVTPHVIGDRIFMDVRVDKGDAIMNPAPTPPSTKTSTLTTKVLIDTGETVVIGGLIEQTKSDTITQVPFLSKLPLLGWLFKKKTAEDDKKELLIFITPTIIKKG
jgi:type IV pilus assembly protein PilQ